MAQNPIDDILGNPVDVALKPEPVAQSWTDRAATAVRGYGQGITAGAIQYPQAALMAATSDQTYKQSLADLRGQNQELAKQDPLAWYGGQVVGAGSLGVLTGGGGALAQTGKLAAQGAVGGFTENESLKDAAVGAGTGVVLGGVSKGASMVTESARNAFLKRASDAVLSAEAKANPQKTIIDAAKGEIAVRVTQAMKDGKPLTAEQQQAIYKSVLDDLKFMPVAKSFARGTWEEIKSAVQPAAWGATIGAGIAAAKGQDPTTGAMVGAGAVVGATKLKVLDKLSDRSKEVAGRVLETYPRAAAAGGNVAGSVATSATTPVAVQMATAPVEENPLDAILGVPPLRQLAHEFKMRNATSGTLRRNAYVAGPQGGAGGSW